MGGLSSPLGRYRGGGWGDGGRRGGGGGIFFRWVGRGGFFSSVVDVPVIISDKLQQSIVDENLEVPKIQFIDRVVDIPVVLQRRVPTVQTVQKTGEIPQVVFLDTVETPVVVQRQVLGL